MRRRRKISRQKKKYGGKGRGQFDWTGGEEASGEGGQTDEKRERQEEEK